MSNYLKSDAVTLEGLKVGVVIDGVLADFIAVLKPAAATVLNCGVDDLTEDQKWNFNEWGGWWKSRAVRENL